MAQIREAVTLPDETEVDVILSTDATITENLETILGAEGVKAAIEQAAENSYPALHYRHGNDVIESRTAGEVVDAFLDSGEISSAEEIVEGWVDEGDYYATLRAENFGSNDEDEGWGLFLASAAAAITRATGNAVDADEVREKFEEMVEDALREADDTGPLEQMKHALNIGIVYVAGKETGWGVDDLSMTPAFGTEVSASTVRPDDNFRRFLEFVNLSFDDFRAAVSEAHGVDLWALPVPADSSSMRREAIERASAEWRAFECPVDTSRPALVTAEQAVELLDNASYGGVPVAYAYVEPKAVLDLPWDEEGSSIRIEPERDNGRVLIGIHDFCNGSGHSVDVKGPVDLPLDNRAWHVDGQRYGSRGIDSVYGLANGVFRCRVEAVELAPAPMDGGPRGPLP